MLTGLAILLLGLGDPKRRRTYRLAGAGPGRRRRALLTAVSLLPGALLLGMGQGAAFLIWLGGASVIGWLATFALGLGAPIARDRTAGGNIKR